MSIVCVGQLVADVVVRPVAGMPPPGKAETIEELEVLAGGCAANTAAVLAKLGVETRLVALAGRDALADAVLSDLKAAGVRVETVRRDAAVRTSAVIVLVDRSGERSFLYRRGGNESLSNRHVSHRALQGARIVHVGGAMKMLSLDLAELMARAKSFGCATSLDTDWDVYDNWMGKLEGALPKIDYLMTNEEEAAQLTGKKRAREAAKYLLSRGPKVVVVKRGARGAMLATRRDVKEFPAYWVEVRDTTCAGDAFAAGFLRGVSSGRPLAESARLGNAAGALATTQISHRGISSFAEVLDLVKGKRK